MGHLLDKVDADEDAVVLTSTQREDR
jgi:hypothetical protein